MATTHTAIDPTKRAKDPPRIRSHTSKRKIALILAVAAGMSFGVTSPANAETPDDSAAELVATAEAAVQSLDPATAETVVATVEAIVGTSEVATTMSDNTVSQSDGSTVTVEDGNTIEIPTTGNAPVQVTTSTGDTIAIDLPVPTGAEAVVVEGLSIYPTQHGAITQQATEDGGARTIFTLNGPEAPTTYSVGITVNSGGSLALQPDGAVAIVNPDGTVNSGLAAPWAKDANDNQVPTWYTVEGNTVTQHINTTAVTAWPVTADPFWSVFGSYMKCVLGAGVPLGIAYIYIGYIGWTGLQVLATQKAATSVPGLPAGWGSLVKPYAVRVYNNCAQFVRS